MRERVKQSVLSVCLSICNVCVPDRDQSSSLLRISSSFLFNVVIVCHFEGHSKSRNRKWEMRKWGNGTAPHKFWVGVKEDSGVYSMKTYSEACNTHVLPIKATEFRLKLGQAWANPHKCDYTRMLVDLLVCLNQPLTMIECPCWHVLQLRGFSMFTQLYVVTSQFVMFIHCACGSKMELDPNIY